MTRRRQLLDYALGATAGAAVIAAAYPALRMIEPLSEGDSEATIPDLAPGEVRLVQMGSRPALVVRRPDGRLTAFVAVCPHLGCTLHYDAERGDIACACHGGRFALDGRNTAGPPMRPLEQLDVGAPKAT